jgi:hypothetical protein
MSEDFGFTFTSEEDVKKEETDSKNAIYEKVLPFLQKLRGDDSDIINWPHETRHKQIDNFIKDIEKLL